MLHNNSVKICNALCGDNLPSMFKLNSVYLCILVIAVQLAYFGNPSYQPDRKSNCCRRIFAVSEFSFDCIKTIIILTGKTNSIFTIHVNTGYFVSCNIKFIRAENI